MRVQELLEPPKKKVLLEGKHLEVFKALLPYLLIEQNGNGGGNGGGNGETGGEVPEVTPAPAPTQPLFGWYRGGPQFWVYELHRTLKNLAVAANIQKRLKELGIKGPGAQRIDAAVANAGKAAKALLTSPGAVLRPIPVWTTKKPAKTTIKRWNEAFERAFAKELGKIDLSEGE